MFEDDQAFENDDTPSTTIGLGNSDAGVINVPTRPNDGGAHDGRVPEASAGDAGMCSGPLVAGDLRIIEIMVSSKTGQGDTGEWVEVQSSRVDCSLNIKGLTISSPRGTSAFDTVTINQDVIIPPYGFFVVADSNDALKNGGITGQVIAWGASDVLRNDGDTIELAAGGVTVDKVTYPALGATPGVSFAFPWDCAWSDRSTWARWSKSVATFGSGSILKGTPNQDNVDVACY